MTTPTVTRTTAATAARPVPVAPVTQRRAIRAEWIKISTLRSTWLVMALAVLGTVVVGAVASWAEAAHWATANPGERDHFSAIDTSLTGINLAQLAIGVLGVLVVTGEYATGMIRSSLAAAPRRLPVLTAKTVVFAVMTAAAMTLASPASFFVGQALLGSHGTTLAAAGAVRCVVGAVLYLIAVAVIAVALGFVTRSTAGGIAALVGLLLLIPTIGQVLPKSWQAHVLPYLPSNAGISLYAVHGDPSASLSPLAGFITLVVWTLVALAAAALMLRRRDA